jgi:hypothetical protein
VQREPMPIEIPSGIHDAYHDGTSLARQSQKGSDRFLGRRHEAPGQAALTSAGRTSPAAAVKV